MPRIQQRACRSELLLRDSRMPSIRCPQQGFTIIGETSLEDVDIHGRIVDEGLWPFEVQVQKRKFRLCAWLQLHTVLVRLEFPKCSVEIRTQGRHPLWCPS